MKERERITEKETKQKQNKIKTNQKTKKDQQIRAD
jgi:hypothetical protein